MNHISSIQTEAVLPPGALPASMPSAVPPERQDMPSEGFGRRVRGAMLEAKLTPARLGKRVGLTTNEIKDILSEAEWCTLEHARELAAVLNADLSWLWLGREAAPRQSAAQGPDAELIALCARHDARLAEANRVGNTDPATVASDQKVTRLVGEASQAEAAITTMRATTADGIVALARTTAAAADGMLIDNDTDPLLRMLLRDALALDTAGHAPVASPDAELIALCEQFIELERRFDATDFAARPGTVEAEAAAREQRGISEAQVPILDRMDELPTTTLAGARARARAIAAYDKGEIEKEGEARGMLWMLIRDLAGKEAP